MRAKRVDTADSGKYWVFALVVYSALFAMQSMQDVHACEPDCGGCMHWVSTGPEPNDGYCALNDGASCGDVVVIGGEEQCTADGNCQSCDTETCDCYNDESRCNGCEDCLDNYEGYGTCQSICTHCYETCAPLPGVDPSDWTCSAPCGECGICNAANECVPNHSLCNGDLCEECNEYGYCTSYCEGGECCDGAGTCEEPGQWVPWGTSVTLELNPAIKGQIERALENIPGVGSLHLEEMIGEATGNIKDCCDGDGFLVNNGQKKFERKVTLGAELGKISIYGASFSKDAEWLSCEFSVDGQIGVWLDASFAVSAMKGERWNSCNPTEECVYGAGGGALPLSLNVGGEIIECHKIGGMCACSDIIIKGSASGSLNGEITYNQPSCTSGLGGSFELLGISASAELSLDGLGISVGPWQIYP